MNIVFNLWCVVVMAPFALVKAETSLEGGSGSGAPISISAPRAFVAGGLPAAWVDKGPGKVYYAEQLEGLPFPEVRGTSIPVSEKAGGFYDLWETVENANAEPNHSLAIRWTVSVPKPSHLWISIGFNDHCILYVNRKPIWGRIGRHGHRSMEYMVDVVLNSGENEITCFTEKARPWESVPRIHFEDAWMLDIKMFTDEGSAWRSFGDTNFHFLENPVVESWEKLRSNVTAKSLTETQVLDNKGVRCGNGYVDSRGTLRWENRKDLPDNFAGVVVQHGMAEAIVVGAPKRELRGIEGGTDSLRAWVHRLEDLQGTPKNERKEWWARRYALAVYKTGADSNPVWEEFYFPSRLLVVREYRSKLDASVQYYLLYKNKQSTHSLPLAVIWPGVPAPVQSFLRSHLFTDLAETEILVSEARKAGVDLMWPGLVDVDYGGSFALGWIAEALENARANQDVSNESTVSLVGYCSGGAGVLNYLRKQSEIRQAVLWSPVVRAPNHKWLNGLDTERSAYPAIMEINPDFQIDAFDKTAKLFILFDLDFPGHGNRGDTRAFEQALRQSGASVESCWLNPAEPCFLYGPRSRASERIWLGWLARNATKASYSDSKRTNLAAKRAPRNVKEALLRGFDISNQNRPALELLLESWRCYFRAYRGGDLPFRQDEQKRSFTEIVEEPTDGALAFLSRLGGEPQLPYVRLDMLVGIATPIWGFRLAETSENSAKVTVFHSGPLPAFLPKIDLLVDGPCQAAAWYFENETWKPLQVWK